MPIYEFVCNACGRPFEELCRMNESGAELACPECGRRGATKKLSTFQALGLRPTRPDSCTDCPLTDCTGCPSHSGLMPGPS